MSDLEYNSADDIDLLRDTENSDPPASETVPPAQKTHADPAHNDSSLNQILAAIQSLSQRLDSLENKPKSVPDKGKRKSKATEPPPAKKLKLSSGMSTALSDEEDAQNSAKGDSTADLTRELLGDSEEEDNDMSTEEDDIYSELESSFAATEKKGPPVDHKLAKLLQERFGERMQDKQLKEKLLAYPIPENCPNMNVPRTNQEIFNALQPQIRRADLRLVNTQQSISRAAVAITSCADRLLSIRRRTKTAGNPPPSLLTEITQCIENLADALALTGHATKDLAQKRRDLHRSKLPAEAAGICAPHVPMTPEWLYPHGAEFYKSLTEAKAHRKLSQEIRGQTRREPGYRGQGQRYHPGSTGSRGAFLGHRGSAWSGPYRGRKPWFQGRRGGNHGASQHHQ